MDPCRRRAWLTLGDLSTELEDLDAGYACSELNLGLLGEPREAMWNRPDADGVDDLTRLMGARLVSARIVAGGWGTRTMDDVARQFAPYMVPSVRPVLHWVLDTPENDYAERTLTLRAATYSSPVAGGELRDIDLAWVAADPIAYDPLWKTATAWALESVTGGRRYPLTYGATLSSPTYPDRVYPPITGGGLMAAVIVTGDFPAWLRLRMYGPGDNPVATLWDADRMRIYARIALGAQLIAGEWVEVDLVNRTAVDFRPPGTGGAGDGMRLINWQQTTWGAVPAHTTAILTYTAGTPTTSTQCVATWREGYVS